MKYPQILQRRYEDGTTVIVQFNARYSGTVLKTNNPDRFFVGEYISVWRDSEDPSWTKLGDI
jgi:hypothetical protein